MEVKREEYLPDPSLSNEEMKQMQLEIAEESVFECDGSPDLLAGVDQAFLDEKTLSSVVVMKDGEVLEKVKGVAQLEIPYIPGLLAFREGKAIVNALRKLESDPDMLILDGSGRIHFRQAGIASHIGVIFDLSSIGVAKNLLCRKVDLPGKMPVHERRKVLSDHSVENLKDGERIGYAYQSKQYSSPNRSINPLYISPGHRMSSDEAVEIISGHFNGYKLPEPVRLADRKVDELKQAVVD